MRKMKNSHGRTWNMARNTEKCGKLETHTVGPGKGRETVKNMKNEKCTLQEEDCGEKTEKHGK